MHTFKSYSRKAETGVYISVFEASLIYTEFQNSQDCI